MFRLHKLTLKSAGRRFKYPAHENCGPARHQQIDRCICSPLLWRNRDGDRSAGRRFCPRLGVARNSFRRDEVGFARLTKVTVVAHQH